MTSAEINIGYWGKGAFVPDEELGYKHQPNFKEYHERKNCFRVLIATDSLGLRNTNQKQSKSLYLGDSYTFGFGVEHPFPSILEGINGAQTGYCIGQEYILGKRLIEQFQPDTVVLALFLINDILGDYKEQYKNTEVVDGLRLNKDRIKGLDFFRTNSFLYMYLYSIYRNGQKAKKWEEANEISKTNPEKFIKNSLTQLNNIINLCKTNNVHLRVVFIPFYLNETSHKPQFEEILVKHKIPFLNLKLGKSHYFACDGHFNQQGHEEAARQIKEFNQSRSYQ